MNLSVKNTNNGLHVGLYFGSFNPIHIGHLIVAEHILQNTDIDRILFIVSPQNPLKKQSELLEDNMRLHLVGLAIQDNDNFVASSVEFTMKKPSYTINTLRYLQKNNINTKFSLIMGQDNLCRFDEWKDYEEIINNFDIYVYPRANCKSSKFDKHKNIHLINSPMVEISASYIRKLIKQGQSIRYLVNEEVREEIEKNTLYRQ